MIILYILFLIYFLLGLGQYGYIGAMGVKRNFKNLNVQSKVLLAPHLAAFILYDIVVLNLILGTAYFRQIPKEWTLSTRLDRLSKGNSWEARNAKEFCKIFLNDFDPSGHHCG